MAAHATVYARMLGPQGSARFAVRQREALATALQQRFQDGDRPATAGDVPLPVHVAYLAGALTGVIAHYTSSEERPPPADAATATWRLLGIPPG